VAEGKQVINPPGLFNATALGFSQAVRVGETVYCSGQVSMGGGTLEEQCHDALLNVRKLLAASGATTDDIVKVTIYCTDEDGWRKTADVRAEFLRPPFPAVTFVVVKALATPRINIEVDVTAVIGAAR